MLHDKFAIALLRGRLLRCAAVALGLASAPDVVVWAQEPAAVAQDAAVVRFEPDYFARYAPQTALDMVRRTPGFTIDEGEERRGFAGAAGNVLINGARPAAKSATLEEILSRIPTAQVVRLELQRSPSSGEAAGHSVVLNVVVKESGGSGVYWGQLEHSRYDRISPSGSFSYAGETGDIDWTIGAERVLERYPLDGVREFTSDDGVVLSRRTDLFPRTWRQAAGNVGIAAPLAGGVLHVNGEARRMRFASQIESLGFTPEGAAANDFRVSIEERERQRELSADWERKAGPFTVKFLGLDRLVWFALDESTASRDANDEPTGLVSQRTRRNARETVGRATLGWQAAPAWRFDMGGEAALNTLESQIDLLIDDGSGPQAQPLPAGDVTVEEKRGEVFFTANWKPAERWAFEGGVTYETSTLSQSGDTRGERTLSFWKPSLQASRTIGADDQIRLRLFRDVSQLDFEDFTTSATLGDERVSAGNPDLRPQTSWRLEGVYDLRFARSGALTATLAREWVEDVADLVALPDRSPSAPPGTFFDGPGNLGSGDVWELRMQGAAPLTALLPGGHVEFSVTLREKRVTDPLTRRERPFTEQSDVLSTINFRQDLPARKLAWGAGFEKNSQIQFFRVSEIESYEEGPFFQAFVETTAIRGVKLRLTGRNLLNTDFRRERRFYETDRNGDTEVIETRRRAFGKFLLLEARGAF